MAKTRHYARKAGGFFVSRVKMSKIFGGTVAGALAPQAERLMGPWGSPVALIGVGMATGDDTLQTIGGLQLGGRLSTGLFGNGNGNGGGSGYLG